MPGLHKPTFYGPYFVLCKKPYQFTTMCKDDVMISVL